MRVHIDMRSNLVVCLFMVCAFAAVTAFSSGYTSATPKQSSTPRPSYPQFTLCDASDIPAMLAKGGLFNQPTPDPEDALRLINDRIRVCRAKIDAFNSPAPTPTPPPVISTYDLPDLPSPSKRAPIPLCAAIYKPQNGDDKMKEVRAAYVTLLSCAQWVARYVPSPAPDPTYSPTPPGTHLAKPRAGNREKVIYVLALASDAPTSAQLSIQLANALSQRPLSRLSYDQGTYTYIPVAEPTWTVAQYQQQCNADSSTGGAIVMMQTSSASGSWNGIVVAGQYTRIGLQAMTLDCEPTNRSYVNNTAFITWFSRQDEGTFSQKDTLGIFGVPLASALATTAAVVALSPNRTVTYSYATPPPAPGGSVAYTSSYTESENAPAALAASAAITGLAPLSSTTIGWSPGADAMTRHTILNVVGKGLIPDMRSSCSPAPPPTPTPDVHTKVPPMTQCDWFDWSKP
jgi:hypothetical protein